jgi:hypothetical protein
MPPKRLTAEQIARFNADGVVFPVAAIGSGEARDALRKLEELEAARAGRLPPSQNAKPHLLLPWLWDLVHDSRIVDAVEDLLGPDILCWGTSFISKRPADERYVTWHQDATHWGLSLPAAVTAWVALTPSTRRNGCVRMLPGTHARQQPHDHPADPRNMLGRRERVTTAIDECCAVDVELAAGEMSLHHPLVIHGSEPNRSDQRRTGFAIRYIPAHVEQTGGRRNCATLVRGRDHGLFDLEERPRAPFDPAAVRHHAFALRKGMSIIFEGARDDAR